MSSESSASTERLSGDGNTDALFMVEMEEKCTRVVEKPQMKAYAPSELLSKLDSFLPQIAKANTDLASKIKELGDSKSVDVNLVENEEGQHIEMDVQWMFDVIANGKGDSITERIENHMEQLVQDGKSPHAGIQEVE